MLFFSVADTVTQRKRSGNFHCNIFRSAQDALEAAFGMHGLPCSGRLVTYLDMDLRIGSRQLKSNTRSVRHGIW